MKKLLCLLKNLFKKVGQVFFVGAKDVLPEPLSKEEELKYLKEMEEGSVDAKNKLIEHNLRLVVYLSKKYENTKIDLEDLVSIGTIGLIKGINTYKIGKNIKLATYASRCIDNEILMYLRKNKKRNADVSLEESLSFDAEGNELHLEDILGTDPDLVTKELEDNDLKMTLLKEIEKLPNGFSLLVMSFHENSAVPYFNDCVKSGECPDKLGIVAYYSNRCPYTDYYVNGVLRVLAQEINIPLKVIKLETREQAQNSPTPATIFSLFYNGKFVTTDLSICTESKFTKLLK